jgi:RimJ/RimL family protein N-acetyltransferase
LTTYIRKKGIAGNIISKLTEYCKDKNINWIALIAAPGSVTLYEKLGFEKMIDHTPMQFQAK